MWRIPGIKYVYVCKTQRNTQPLLRMRHEKRHSTNISGDCKTGKKKVVLDQEKGNTIHIEVEMPDIGVMTLVITIGIDVQAARQRLTHTKPTGGKLKPIVNGNTERAVPLCWVLPSLVTASVVIETETGTEMQCESAREIATAIGTVIGTETVTGMETVIAVKNWTQVTLGLLTSSANGGTAMSGCGGHELIRVLHETSLITATRARNRSAIVAVQGLRAILRARAARGNPSGLEEIVRVRIPLLLLQKLNQRKHQQLMLPSIRVAKKAK
jgi:hypothetical protein